MEKIVLNQRIQKTEEELTRLQNDLCAVGRTNPLLYPENFSELTAAAALRSEKITCMLRQLACFPPSRRPVYLSQAAEAQGISISDTDGILLITLPCLLPRRQAGRRTDFLMEPLYYSLQEYAMNHPPVSFPYSAVCFFHIYNEALHRQTRDYDNLEYKQVLDAAALFFLPDDSGACCDVFHTTRSGPEDQTHIYIMDAERLPAWLEEQKRPDPHVGKNDNLDGKNPTWCYD